MMTPACCHRLGAAALLARMLPLPPSMLALGSSWIPWHYRWKVTGNPITVTRTITVSVPAKFKQLEPWYPMMSHMI
jgi:hypothetical protein